MRAGFLVFLMLANLALSAPALTNFAANASLSVSTGTISNPEHLFDNNSGSKFVWSGTPGLIVGDKISIALAQTTKVASVVMVQGGTDKVRKINLYAGTASDGSDMKMCNDGQPVTTCDAINCMVDDAEHIFLEII